MGNKNIITHQIHTNLFMHNIFFLNLVLVNIYTWISEFLKYLTDKVKYISIEFKLIFFLIN